MTGSIGAAFINPIIGGASQISLQIGIMCCGIIGILGSLLIIKMAKVHRRENTK